jgi:hypothetical protein
MFAIELLMEKRKKKFLSAWFSDLPAINATSFRLMSCQWQRTATVQVCIVRVSGNYSKALQYFGL